MNTENQLTPLQLGLSFCAGAGLTLMMVAVGIGVVQGEGADGGLLGILFVIGVGLLAAGIIAWFAVTQPHTHFDDINDPLYHGHDHEHDEHHTEEEKAVIEHQA